MNAGLRPFADDRLCGAVHGGIGFVDAVRGIRRRPRKPNHGDIAARHLADADTGHVAVLDAVSNKARHIDFGDGIALQHIVVRHYRLPQPSACLRALAVDFAPPMELLQAENCRAIYALCPPASRQNSGNLLKGRHSLKLVSNGPTSSVVLQ